MATLKKTAPKTPSPLRNMMLQSDVAPPRKRRRTVRSGLDVAISIKINGVLPVNLSRSQTLHMAPGCFLQVYFRISHSITMSGNVCVAGGKGQTLSLRLGLSGLDLFWEPTMTRIRLIPHIFSKLRDGENTDVIPDFVPPGYSARWETYLPPPMSTEDIDWPDMQMREHAEAVSLVFPVTNEDPRLSPALPEVPPEVLLEQPSEEPSEEPAEDTEDKNSDSSWDFINTDVGLEHKSDVGDADSVPAPETMTSRIQKSRKNSQRKIKKRKKKGQMKKVKHPSSKLLPCSWYYHRSKQHWVKRKSPRRKTKFYPPLRSYSARFRSRWAARP